ncbi:MULTISPECIES: VanZ family protein [Actinoalloteichus]|uniref:Glycopeptide antibiotics resistance protein n=1 Tax=Actinoalloteichus fjordicus TaxID=1612552 RepID=A0AAC9PRA9_9PSEU|nr:MULTISPECIES: VanZ family protein [Actinoalloteichus]APU13880.1 glycopeptide antibiotics resistance protein [Actinoalloteichus fjordicus]APU19826.1 glycopeptide antibiotics resistance protein [Actinoalloteichus sp. GBA129-24]
MSIRVLPGFVALTLAIVVAALAFLPYVARQYRRRGQLGLGHALIAFAFLCYILGLLAYVLIPIPPVGPGFCEAYSWVRPQLTPLASLSGLPATFGSGGVRSLLVDSAFQQFAMNIALFVPMGMFVRHMFRRGFLATIAIGAAATLFIEFTQLTGIWFLYPCPYRLFDVDDLAANGLGAVVGAVLAPLLRLVPGQRTGAAPGVPRPVTASRRLLGMACDLLVMWLSGNVALLIVTAAVGTGGAAEDGLPWIHAVAQWGLPAALIGTSLVVRRATPGQQIVLLRLTSVDGGRAAALRAVVWWISGFGAFGVLQTAALIWWAPAVWAAVALAGLHAVSLLLTADRRGISGMLSGLHAVDVRVGRDGPAGSATPETDEDDQTGEGAAAEPQRQSGTTASSRRGGGSEHDRPQNTRA